MTNCGETHIKKVNRVYCWFRDMRTLGMCPHEFARATDLREIDANTNRASRLPVTVQRHCAFVPAANPLRGCNNACSHIQEQLLARPDRRLLSSLFTSHDRALTKSVFEWVLNKFAKSRCCGIEILRFYNVMDTGAWIPIS